MHLKDHLTHIAGASTSILGTLTANMEHFDYWFRQFGTLVAVCVGVATIWSIFRKRKLSSESK